MVKIFLVNIISTIGFAAQAKSLVCTSDEVAWTKVAIEMVESNSMRLTILNTVQNSRADVYGI